MYPNILTLNPSQEGLLFGLVFSQLAWKLHKLRFATLKACFQGQSTLKENSTIQTVWPDHYVPKLNLHTTMMDFQRETLKKSLFCLQTD